ncbi:MAG TPA: DEAD/DEAH box helicase [Bacteroidetes bacterium]|nr:DEAD/DEAH box helicase [Bacteroidota bacterium]
MTGVVKDRKGILKKLQIAELKPMQVEAHEVIQSGKDLILLSPTGTGKTLAFLLPVIEGLKADSQEVQGLILVPSRELAIQIEQVTREMGTGFKTNAVYGGRSFSKDKIEIKHRPAILIGTPGRVADHLRRGTFSAMEIETLVLDEFDKSLEVGFEEEMREITEALPMLKQRILTSATQEVDIPDFVGLSEVVCIDYLADGVSQLEIKTILSPDKDKLDTLVEALCHLGNQPGIIFCNFRDSIQRVSEFLDASGVRHGCFHGGMEQLDRERTLVKFRNGTHQVILATDLAARGIDIPELKFIIHYHLPQRSHEFTHRNGRTARMNSEGTAYVLKWQGEKLPDFIQNPAVEILLDAPLPKPSKWATLFLSGGRRDKISKGDIAGLFFKQGKLEKDELGVIELKQDCAFVGVPLAKADQLIRVANNVRLKKKKIRVTVI